MFADPGVEYPETEVVYEEDEWKYAEPDFMIDEEPEEESEEIPEEPVTPEVPIIPEGDFWDDWDDFNGVVIEACDFTTNPDCLNSYYDLSQCDPLADI